MRIYPTSTSERFWAKVSRGAPDECWEWTGAKNKTLAAVFWFWGKTRPATHWAWIEYHGLVPEGKIVCHHCDNPPCMNPSHLFIGTDKDNSDDKILKGRAKYNPVRGAQHYLNLHPDKRQHGEDVHNSKLTNAQVREIRGHLRDGLSPTLIARRYGVSYDTIHLIELGKRYAFPEAGWIEVEVSNVGP